jgi:hypothetical protein
VKFMQAVLLSRSALLSNDDSAEPPPFSGGEGVAEIGVAAGS